ncbi:MAG: hypothetical protein D8M58_20840 [Calditrichaeota bacterium]|nr:MAG: hypothetical protein DWQ03_01170 [Calditrichota bacterium]MBL1207858.1 hypothetical protein [Calditrichota bacterium]NOG47692.1 hypothetical protein [Calditrichota bacterium]
MKFISIAFLTFLFGCIGRPIIKKPVTEIHQKQNKIIEQAVSSLAKTGDWLVIRGFHATSNLVANATGIPISHVAIYDSVSKTVIEADGKGVHTSTIKEFVDKSYRLLIIRPRWRTDENAKTAWQNADKLLGKDYDYLGTIGFNYPGKYYCSELAIKIYNPWFSGKEKFPDIIKPGELYLYGNVLYDSLPREEM